MFQETCVYTRSQCVPPGLRRGQTQCTLRRERVNKGQDCGRLGLTPCQCPEQHENSVYRDQGCQSCCRSATGSCRSANQKAVFVLWTNEN